VPTDVACPRCRKRFRHRQNAIVGMFVCPACGASLPTVPTGAEIESALTPKMGRSEALGATLGEAESRPEEARELTHGGEPFDFEAIATEEPTTDDNGNGISLGDAPAKAWGNVYRGLGIIAIATLIGPAVACLALIVPLVILVVGAVGLITAEDVTNWLFPMLIFIPWFVPLVVAAVRMTGLGFCVAAPSEAGVKGLALAGLVLNGLLVASGAATLALAALGNLQDDATLQALAWASLVPYMLLTVIEVIVLLFFLNQVAKALKRPELAREVVRFYIWLAVWVGCQAGMMILMGVFRAVLLLAAINVVIFASFLVRYLLVLRTARGALVRIFRLKLRPA
jgi:hypothetical protein